MTLMAGVLKERIGDCEITHANPDMLRILEKVIDQHGRILEMHSQIVKAFATPPLIVHQPSEEKADD